MIRRAVPAAIAALALLAPAHAGALSLVREDTGRPVAASWQHWATAAHVPLPRGTVSMTTVRALCWSEGAPDYAVGGCSSAGAPWELAASDRGSLYVELGHIFDAQRLKGWQRAYFARRWRVPHARWLDSSASLDAGVEDGLMVAFAQVYGDCAAGVTAPRWLVASTAPAIHTGPWACRAIRRFAR